MIPSSFFCIPVYKNCLLMKQRRQFKDNENKDIISDLHDSLLIYILSFLNAKQAVQTCILSKRWIFLWKSLPNLTLSSSHFRFQRHFNEFTSQILSIRDGSTSIHTLNLNCQDSWGLGVGCQDRVELLIEYAVSHNIKHLVLNYTSYYIKHFPSCIFSCHTLASLHLSVDKYYLYTNHKPIFPNSLNLPALTILYLKNFAFAPSHDGCVDPFSGLKMLNTLTIDHCIVLKAQNLCISSAKLVNLTILMWTDFGFNFGIELYAPNLHTFALTGSYALNIFGSKSSLSSIKQVSIDLSWYNQNQKLKLMETSPLLLNLLVKLANIESLTFYSKTLEVLSTIPGLLKFKFHSLRNLKSLKMTRSDYYSSRSRSKTKAFLMQNSPSAKFKFIRL